MTWLLDRERAVKSLEALEPTWGGDIATRIAAQATKTDAAVPSDSAAVRAAASAATNTQEDLAVDGPQGNTVAEDGTTERGNE